MLTLRPATPDDAPDMVRLIEIASDGLASAAWRIFAAPGQEALDYGLSRARRETGSFCWPNATMAEWGGESAGMLVAHRLDHPDDPADWPELFRPFIEMENARPGFTYVAALAVYPEWRGRGIARALMATLPPGPACLIRGDANPAARLYRALGFTDSDSRPAISGAGWTSPYAHWVRMDRPGG